MDKVRVLRGGRGLRAQREESDWLGLAASAIAGIGLGVVSGLAFSQWFSEVSPGKVTGAVRRIGRRREDEPDTQPVQIERAVNGALSENPKTRQLDVRARALGEGIVELTGNSPDRDARSLAATIARGVSGVTVVVNRILVNDEDVPRTTASPKVG
jgi:osmotically-inducible protein OsmY